jgi:hypothetical protein
MSTDHRQHLYMGIIRNKSDNQMQESPPLQDKYLKFEIDSLILVLQRNTLISALYNHREEKLRSLANRFLFKKLNYVNWSDSRINLAKTPLRNLHSTHF